MKIYNGTLFCLLAAAFISLDATSAKAFYNPATGRWLNRDPVCERGGVNLYGFSANNPVAFIDALGLAYTIMNLDPTGWWGVTLADVDVGAATFKGFHARYLPSDGQNDHPPCPCKRKEDIFLVQAIDDAVHHPTQFDVYGYAPGGLPPHTPTDPIPGYWWTHAPPLGPLTIVDAPNTSGASGWWHIEDCAVCRTRSGADTADQVLGCVKLVFHRTSDTTAELTVEGGHNPFVNAQAPGQLWKDALANWGKTGK
jgi:hypothetical protein